MEKLLSEGKLNERFENEPLENFDSSKSVCVKNISSP